MSSVQFVLCCYVGFDLRCLSHSLRFSSLAQIFYWCRIIRRRKKNQEKDKMEKDNTLFVRLSYIHLRSYYIVCIFFPFEGITIHLSLSNSLSLRIGSELGRQCPLSLRRLETRGVKSQRKWVNSNGVLVRLFYVNRGEHEYGSSANPARLEPDQSDFF